MTPEEAYAFYQDPENQLPAGPVAGRRLRPGLRDLRYEGTDPPLTQTVNTGSLPFFVKG